MKVVICYLQRDNDTNEIIEVMEGSDENGSVGEWWKWGGSKDDEKGVGEYRP